MPPAPKNSGRKKRTDGEGSIYYDEARGKFIGALVVGYRDGKPVRRKVSANTKSGAATKLRELREEHQATTLPVGKVASVEQWMNYWLNNIAARKVGELTLNNSYRQKVRDYIIPLLGHHRLDRLTPDLIEEAWNYLADVGNPKKDDPDPLSANTVHQTHAILRRALKVAVQRKRLASNPAGADSMDAPPAEDRDIDPLTMKEARAVLEAAKSKRNGARWAIALGLGLRQGEALGLTWDNVDLDAGELRVRQALKRVKGKGLILGSVKSKKSKRELPIPPELLALLKAHKKAQTAERLEAGSAWEGGGFVFCQPNGRPIDPSRDYQSWQALLKEAKVKPYRLHAARHSAATFLLLEGVDTRVVMDLLGHSQISVTAKYQHAVDEAKKSATAKMGSALMG